MIGTIHNRAEVEYAVMLAVLDFQTEFMNSRYTRAQVRLVDYLIEIVLTGAASIPAEERLAQSREGRALLQQVHTSLFTSGESLLRDRLEHDLGVKIACVFSRLDVRTGQCTLIIKLEEWLCLDQKNAIDA